MVIPLPLSFFLSFSDVNISLLAAHHVTVCLYGISGIETVYLFFGSGGGDDVRSSCCADFLLLHFFISFYSPNSVQMILNFHLELAVQGHS